jgi:hypothetical protein
MRVIFLEDRLARRPIEPDEAVSDATLTAEQAIPALFQQEGLDLFPLALSSLRHFVTSVVPRHIQIASYLSPLLATLESPVLLGGCSTTVETIAALACGRERGIPTVVHQHGGFVGYAHYPMHHHFETPLATHYLCYGDGVARVVREESSPAAPGVTSVGSADLDALRKRRRTKPTRTAGRRVVYVMTVIMGDERYFTNHTYPDIWYWRLQREVLELCCREPETRLTAKLYPSDFALNPI